jgi:serpin B
MRAGLAVALVAIWTLGAGTAAGQGLMPPEFPLAQAENEFAFDLYGQLSQRPGNLVFSPFSVANALDMVFLGAKGATADEMAAVLHLQVQPGADLPSALVKSAQERMLFPSEYSPNAPPAVPPDGFQFENADALWGAREEPFEPSYLASVKSAFGGDLFPTDFADAHGAAARINAWVTGKTHGRITELISPSAITPQTRLVLTDAVYFKAGWATDFDEAASKPGVFHVAPGQDVTVRMMHAAGHYSMTRGDGMEMLEIPYRYGDASLLIILPDEPSGLAGVESELSAQKLSFWLEYRQQFNVAMSIPAFKTGSSFDLSTVLQALGMKRAFIPFQADLSLIADDKVAPLYVGNVVHKAFIDVHEKGTEAAAATGVMTMGAAGIEPPVEDVTFVADHPFIYVIRANGSGDILFMGRVDNPAQDGG